MTIEIIRWAAAIGATIAALMTAANISRRVTGYGFLLFAVTSVLWVTAGWLEDKSALVFQNAVLLAINAFGVYRWLWLKRGEPEAS